MINLKRALTAWLSQQASTGVLLASDYELVEMAQRLAERARSSR